MEVNIFPFTCKIYVVRCKFCDKYLGHLVTEDDEHHVTEPAEKRFSWCSVGCEEKIKKAKRTYGETWLKLDLLV